MRVLIQRVREAKVTVEGFTVGKIGCGLLVFAGFEADDGEEDIQWICGKIHQIRLFNDAEGVMNLSLNQVGGEVLLISQFTLHASTRKGNRPSYIRAARPEIAKPLYDHMAAVLSQLLEKQVEMGVFGAMMEVSLMNDGPVTIWIDSRNKE